VHTKLSLHVVERALIFFVSRWQARKSGRYLVSTAWLSTAVSSRALLDPEALAIFGPLPCAQETVEGLDGFVFAVGEDIKDDADRALVAYMTSLAGAHIVATPGVWGEPGAATHILIDGNNADAGPASGPADFPRLSIEWLDACLRSLPCRTQVRSCSCNCTSAELGQIIFGSNTF
jgi:hypothetical protein